LFIYRNVVTERPRPKRLIPKRLKPKRTDRNG